MVDAKEALDAIARLAPLVLPLVNAGVSALWRSGRSAGAGQIEPTTADH